LQLENWVKRIKVDAGSKVVDIGGSQNPVKKRLGSPGEASEYFILDLKEPHELKQEPDIVWDLNLGIGTDSFSWQNLGYDKYKRYFDVAFCLEVTEYLFDPVQTLREIESLLKPGGLLYISFHFVYPVHAPEGKDYLRYTEFGANRLLEGAGFEIIENTPRFAEAVDFKFYYDLEKMRGLRNYNHHIIGLLSKCRKK